MSESNNNWVCFECHFTTRHQKTSDKTPKCHYCNQVCVNIGYKFKIPKKNDNKGWEKLQSDYRQMTLHRLESEKNSIQFRISHLKSEIERLSTKEENKDRRRLINSLKEELKKLQNK